MNKLFSAANGFVYGGGMREERFLDSLSKIIGGYDRLSTSTSTGRGQRTVSRQLVRHRILDVDELAVLPKGRAIVLASGGSADADPDAAVDDRPVRRLGAGVDRGERPTGVSHDP